MKKKKLFYFLFHLNLVLDNMITDFHSQCKSAFLNMIALKLAMVTLIFVIQCAEDNLTSITSHAKITY